MKKDIKWLKEAIGELDIVDTVFDVGGVSYIGTVVRVMQVYDLINQLDEPEVLSQEWLDENKSSWTNLKVDGYYIPVEKLQNLLVPKHEELESKIKVLIEAYKQEDGAYSNPENGWISGFVEDLENLVEEEPLYYALIKGHELVNDEGEWSTKYWNLWVSGGCVFPADRLADYDDFLTTMSKEEWSEWGINDTNADFIKVEEIEE